MVVGENRAAPAKSIELPGGLSDGADPLHFLK
jgi:hypothetical protein